MRRHQGAKVEHFDVSNVIYHKFSHCAVSYVLSGENVNDMLEFMLTLLRLFYISYVCSVLRLFSYICYFLMFVLFQRLFSTVLYQSLVLRNCLEMNGYTFIYVHALSIFTNGTIFVASCLFSSKVSWKMNPFKEGGR